MSTMYPSEREEFGWVLKDIKENATKQEPADDRAWCSGCGVRWTSDRHVIPGVVNLCGDCWRKVQAHLQSRTP